MASSNAASRLSNKIVVKGIPVNISPDKIIIHFQKKKNVGGGDVESVTFPKSLREKDSAIVEFSEAETVQSVLRYHHELGGNKLTVREYEHQQVFTEAVCGISPFVIEKLRNEKRENGIYEVQDCTGVTIRKKGDGYEVSGKWYQMQAAYERIERMIHSENETSQHERRGNESGYLPPRSTPSSKSPNASVNGSGTKNFTASLTSVIFDKDILAFINLAHPEKLTEIQKRFGVKYEVKELGESTKVTLTASSEHSKVDAAANACNKLSEEVSRSAAQDIFDVREVKGATDKNIEDVLNEVKPEFPMVWISRVHDQREHLVFIADTTEKCEMARNQFKYILTMRVTPQRKDSDEDKGKGAPFDRDVYKFIELAHSTELSNLSFEYEVTLKPKTSGDAVHVEIKSEGNTSNPHKARKALDKLYAKIVKDAAQELLDLSEEPEAKISKIDDVMGTIGKKYSTILITRIDSDPRSLIFIADNKGVCDRAMQDFKDHLSRYDDASHVTSKDENGPQYFDTDMFGFIQRMHVDELRALKKKYKVKLDIEKTDDAAMVDVRSVGKESDQEGAKKALADLYQKISNSATQLPLDLRRKSQSDLKLMDDVIAIITPQHQRVAISRSVSSKCILFIADHADDLDKAVQHFTRTLNQKENASKNFA